MILKDLLKKYTFSGLLTSMFVCCAILAEGGILGADISYKVKDDSVKITLSTYDDYEYNRASWINTTISIESNISRNSITGKLLKVSTEDITSTCATGCSNYSSTSCSNSNTLVKSTYNTTVSLSEFTGSDCELSIVWSSCCRPNSTEGFYLKTTFNKCIDGENSSPKIINNPYHTIAFNEPYSYSWKAFDKDGDSLVYSLVESKTSETGSYFYEKGLNYKNPFTYVGYPQSGAKFPKGFHFDGRNGLLRFYPTKVMSAPIAVKISEFRNGVKIGESTREITMSVKNISNSKPIVTGLNGGNKESITACVGQELKFNIQATDSDDNDKIDLEWVTDIERATINRTANSKPTIGFSWTPSAKELKEGNYFLKVIAKDNSCELTGVYERIINIKVVSPFEASFSSRFVGCKEINVIAETNGSNDNKLKYEWTVEDNTYYGKDVKLSFLESGAKKAQVVVTNEITGCTDSYESEITIPEMPHVKIIGNDRACANEDVMLNAAGAKDYTWYKNDIKIGDKKKITVNSIDAKNLLVKGSDEYGCTGSATFFLEVLEPAIEAIALEETVCKGNNVIVKATGASNYNWSVNGAIDISENKATYSFLRDEEVFVSGVDDNGCLGSVAVSIKVDQDCVWPGDANGDEEVNNHDVLRLGVAYNETFATDTRKNIEPSWAAYRSANWPQDFTDNSNYKHADANNDGIIDFSDLMVIDKYYTRQISYTNKKGDDGYKLFFDYNIDSLKGKEIVEVDISLGTSDKPAKDVYGIAFSIDYDKYVDSSTIDFNTDGSWLSKGSSMLKLVKNKPGKEGGKIDIAFTRTNKTSKSGHGKVGSVKFVVEDDIDWKKLITIELLLESIEVIDVNGDEIDAYGVSTSIDLAELYSSIHPKSTFTGLSAFPNPTSNDQVVLSVSEKHVVKQASIYSLSGKEVLKLNNIVTGNNVIQLQGLKGYFLLKIETAEGISTIPIIAK